MLTKVNTDMISDPSIVQSSEKLCEIFIALVSEVGARFEESGMCSLHYTLALHMFPNNQREGS